MLRVFCAEDGSGGNELGVFLDGAEVPAERRQEVARELGFAETAFVEDPRRGELRIFTPEAELPLAGHPLVGVAWLLREEETVAAPSALRPPAGETPVVFERELAFVAARPEWGPEFDFVEVGSPEEVEALAGPEEARALAAEPARGGIGVWAWIAEAAGSIRERVFVPALGVPEDEATGSAALRLCARLERPLEIHQGAGSVIYARPLPDGMVQIGGRVVLDGIRDHQVR